MEGFFNYSKNMKLIPITKGKFVKVDDEDYEIITKMGKWNILKSGKLFYAQRIEYPSRTHILIHRIMVSTDY